ncbi:MAG TPA: dihydroneopterin aldolase [Bacteroidia bacterium]
MHLISVEGIKVYAYHGCLEEEGRIGGEYQVDVYMKTNFSEAALLDDLTKTIDYVEVYDMVKAEMAIRSKLIEHVGQRIMDKVTQRFKNLKSCKIRVTKFNPPMNGNVEKVSIEIES